MRLPARRIGPPMELHWLFNTFFASPQGQADIWGISANGGQARRLTTHAAADAVASWSRDGRWIYFRSNRSGEHQIWKMPVSPASSLAAAENQAVQVTKNGGWWALESWDGKFLYFAKSFYRSTPLWALPLPDGQERIIIPSITGQSHFDVAPDGIFYQSDDAPDKQVSLRFYRFSTGKAEIIAPLTKRAIGGLSVSPDHRMVVFASVGEARGDLWLVENFR